MSVNLENFKLSNQICPKNMTDKNFEKINIKVVLSIYIVMYTCVKFKLIWRTSDFGTKFAPKHFWVEY